MAIGTQKVLLKLVDTDTTNLGTTGATVVNSGSLGTDYKVFGTGTTRAASNGLYTGSGRLSGTTGVDANQTYMTITGATAPGSALDDFNCALAFKFTGAALNNTASYLVAPGTSPTDGNIRLSLQPPAATGDFDLTFECRNTSSGAITPLKTGALAGLLFNTVYQVACSVNMAVTGAIVPKIKVNSATVITGATANFTSFAMENAWPILLTRSDFAPGAFDFDGDLYYFAYNRGTGIAWGDSDLDSINADPTVLWGAGPPPTGPPVLYRRGATFVNDELILI